VTFLVHCTCGSIRLFFRAPEKHQAKSSEFCTMPVTSADNERSNSTLKLFKGYLRTTMTTERLSGLALMNIHCEKPVNYDAVIQLFAERYPRRMLLVDSVFDETQN